MKHIEKQKTNIETLLQLVRENPELQIVPMVDYEVVGSDDFSSWMGDWGKSEIDEVLYGDERIYFRSQDEDGLIENLVWNNEFIDGLSEVQAIKKAENEVNNYAWEKVIVVRIVLP